MPVLTTTAIAIGGLALGAAGAGMSYFGQSAAAEANEEARRLQKQQEAQRRKIVELDAVRKKREMIRQAIAARSLGLTRATNQGAAGEGSSALAGVYGGVSGRTGVNMLGVNQNLEVGRTMFGLSNSISDAYGRAAEGQSWAATGGAISSLGGAMIKNLDAINRVGTYLGFGGEGPTAASSTSWGGEDNKSK